MVGPPIRSLGWADGAGRLRAPREPWMLRRAEDAHARRRAMRHPASGQGAPWPLAMGCRTAGATNGDQLRQSVACMAYVGAMSERADEEQVMDM